MISAFLVAGALVTGACGDDAAKAATPADLESYKVAAGAAGHDPARRFGWRSGARNTGFRLSGPGIWRWRSCMTRRMPWACASGLRLLPR